MRRLTRPAIVIGLFVGCSSAPAPAPSLPTEPPAGGRVVEPVAPAPPPLPSGPPVAEVRTVRDTYHGVTVDDPYRWLEGDGNDVKAWSDAHNEHARKVLNALPEIDALRAEVTAIVRAPITYYWDYVVGGKRLFGMRKDPAKEQAELIVFDDLDKPAKLIFDPTQGSSTHRSIDWFVPSPDGNLVAVSISELGSEAGDLHIMDLDGKDVDVVIPRVQRGTGGGSAAWTPDSKGLYYTRYPAANEKPADELEFWMQVWFHARGTTVDKDRYELGKDLPKIAEIKLDADRKGRVIATVQNGDGGEFRHYLRDGGKWRQLDDWADRVVFVGFGTTDDLWLVSKAGAPHNKVLTLAANAKTSAEAKVVIAEGNDTVIAGFDDGIVDGGDRIYVRYQVGGPIELRAFTRTGKPAKGPSLPPVSNSSQPVMWRGTALVSAASYTTPRALYRFTPTSGETSVIAALSPKPVVDLAGFEARRAFAPSKDGTNVPLTVIWPKGAPLDGTRACVVFGYGGYGISMVPGYFQGWWPLLKRGVCVVQANLRGGGEYGEDWHRAGMLTKKQNVFDDFFAVLTYVVDKKYTRRDRLAMLGGSNGGLLMGAVLTQHPDAVKAVVSEVGMYDMLRVEATPNGAFNVTEFGTVKDRDQFTALHAYSPYHHVAKTDYPAVLFTTGANDPRVSPWHSRKMTAALLAAQTGKAPILLRTSATSGHGGGTAASDAIEEQAHVAAFLLWQLTGGR